jgi:hypothetical protein
VVKITQALIFILKLQIVLEIRFIKNSFRSTMGEDRFSALLLLYVHKDIEIDISKVGTNGRTDIKCLSNGCKNLITLKDQTNKMCQSSREICLRKSGVGYA